MDMFDEVDCVTSNKSTVNSEQSLNSLSKEGSTVLQVSKRPDGELFMTLVTQYQ